MSVRLAGGLGNQLFQLAAVLALLRRGRKPRRVVLSTGALGRYRTPRRFELATVLALPPASWVISPGYPWFLRLRLPKLWSGRLGLLSLVGDRNFASAVPGIAATLVDGYFIDSLGQEDFEYSAAEIGQLLLAKVQGDPAPADFDTCLVHIRGGDFVDLGWKDVASRDYYADAVYAVRQKHPRCRFRIITDDRKWAEVLLAEIGLSAEFVSRGMADDFSAIRRAKIRILSNSTFAFWAAALDSPTAGGVTVCPAYWSPGRRRKLKLGNELLVD